MTGTYINLADRCNYRTELSHTYLVCFIMDQNRIRRTKGGDSLQLPRAFCLQKDCTIHLFENLF